MRTRLFSVIVLAVTLPLSAPARAEDTPNPGVQFGLNSFLGNLRFSEVRGPIVRPTPEDRTNYLDAVRDLGCKSIRESFMNWAEIEPERGKGYQWGAFDDIALKASERGIEIIALAYPFPCWATGVAPTPPDQLFTLMYHLPKREFEKDFRSFMSAVVKRYCGRYPDSLPAKMPIRKWIFSNELDAFGVPADDYAFWQRAFWEEVKGADPGATVITMGFSHPANYLAFLEAFLNSPNLKGPAYPYFDVFAFHCYPVNYDPNIYVMNADEGYVRRALTAHAIDVDIWLMETGDRSVNEVKQASQDIKYLLHGASTGVRRVNLHGLWEIGSEDHWGVLGDTPSGQVPVRKPSFTAFQTLLAKIGNNRGIEFLGPGRYRALLPGGKYIYVLWSEGPNTELMGLLTGSVRVTNLRNEESTVAADRLKLTEEPVFVEAAE